jgi:putative transposase
MAEDRMAVLDTVRKALAEGDVDFLREGLRVLAQAVMEAEVTELTGAAKGERAPDRRLTNRNGYRERRWDTRVGTLELAIPKVRDGSYFPSLLEPRRRAERALLAVVQEAYVLGVSTRRSRTSSTPSGSPRSARARSPGSAPPSTSRSRRSGAGPWSSHIRISGSTRRT